MIVLPGADRVQEIKKLPRGWKKRTMMVAFTSNACSYERAKVAVNSVMVLIRMPGMNRRRVYRPYAETVVKSLVGGLGADNYRGRGHNDRRYVSTLVRIDLVSNERLFEEVRSNLAAGMTNAVRSGHGVERDKALLSINAQLPMHEDTVKRLDKQGRIKKKRRERRVIGYDCA